jgi:B12-binding domain/radical SAM domain protein
MRNLDVLFIHPPVVYDFRKRPFFPGPLAETVTHYTTVLIAIPIGLISMSEYLERNGYKVKIVNIGEEMVLKPEFNVREFIKKTEAKIYGIDLHWIAHSQGAIRIAKICKETHPNSLVVLGGLTSTRFHIEIIKKYKFIDVIIRGEGEESILQLVKKVNSDISNIPNITFRDKNGKIKINRLAPPCDTLDNYNFTRIDFIEPKELLLTTTTGFKTWLLPICRGCTYNCVSCGGSAYSYRKLFGRKKPAFRDPEKLIEDIRKLTELGIDGVFLFQDPRIGGKAYVENLIKTFKKEKIDVKQLGIELFIPADKEFLEEISKINVPIILNISPESSQEEVRSIHGRKYTNEELLKTIKNCIHYKFQITVFFMIGLANQSWDSIKETLKFCDKLYKLDRLLRSKEEYSYPESMYVKPRIGPMLLLDPGSLAFDYPEKYGYKLIFKNFQDHYNALSKPSWHQWINYETKYFNRKDIANFILKALEYLNFIEEKYSLISDIAIRNRINYKRFKIKIDKFIMEEIEEIEKMKGNEKRDRILNLNNAYNEFSLLLPWTTDVVSLENDPYNYKTKINELLSSSYGLIYGK